MSVKITCLQLDIAFGNPTKNRKYIEQKMTEALKENPDILVLPELWDTAYDLTRLDEIADDEGRFDREKNRARRHEYDVYF